MSVHIRSIPKTAYQHWRRHRVRAVCCGFTTSIDNVHVDSVEYASHREVEPPVAFPIVDPLDSLKFRTAEEALVAVCSLVDDSTSCAFPSLRESGASPTKPPLSRMYSLPFAATGKIFSAHRTSPGAANVNKDM